MYSKQEIIDKLKSGEMNYFEMLENTKREFFDDLEVARAFIETFGSLGLDFLEHNSDFPSKPRQWRRLKSIASEKEAVQDSFGELSFDELEEPEETVQELSEDTRLERIDRQIEETKKSLEELNAQLEQMISGKSRFFELAEVEVRIVNMKNDLEQLQSIKLSILRAQSHCKENELESIRDRNERLDHYQEQVTDLDKNMGIEDRSLFIG